MEIQAERARRDAVYFAHNTGLEKLDEWQEKLLQWVITGETQGLILNCARQSGKSTISSIAAVYLANYLSDYLIILVSPSQRQSSELFRKCREVIKQTSILIKLEEDNQLSCMMNNGSRIISLPGSEKTIRGYSGAKLIIEDEASRVDDELYMATSPMLAVSHGRHILMSTPFGKRGHFYEAWEDGGDDWERVKVTAWENPRIEKSFLEEEKRKLGDWWFKQEYECEFMDSVDSVFSYEQIMGAITEDIKPLFEVR
jgi:hypothetical protein